MNILLFSYTYAPSVGGVESVSAELYKGLEERGCDVRIVTITEAEPSDEDPKVFRKPGFRALLELVRWSDVVLSNGASMACLLQVLIARKPLVWVHVGYQASCIDGAGWFNNALAPSSPLASIIFHLRHRGLAALGDAFKLVARRLVATIIVSRNIEISQWMKQSQRLRNSVQIYNPVNLTVPNSNPKHRRENDFLFVGRLVSEKGVGTLLRAFCIATRTIDANLTIVGDGPLKLELERLSEQLELGPRVRFLGMKKGDELKDIMSRSRIGVVPSEWHEPMGIVALELLSSGCKLIVSERGGLAECVDGAALTFPNGDAESLAAMMLELFANENRWAEFGARSPEVIARMDPQSILDAYHRVLLSATQNVSC